MTVLTLPQAMRENRRLRAEQNLRSATSVGLVSNVVLTDADTFVEYGLLTQGIDPSFAHGDYGQIAESTLKLAQEVDHVCVVLHVDALAENLPWSAVSWSWEATRDLVDFRLAELRGAIADVPAGVRVHVAAFTGGLATHPAWETTRRLALSHIEAEVRDLAARDNRVLWADVQAGLVDLGFDAAVSAARAARYSAPLTPAGTGVIGAGLAASIGRAMSPARKVLVLDADNTLWGGVLGEDGLDNIALHPTVYPGNVYFRAQSLYRAIKERGILLAVVSKNEPADLIAALDDHPNSQLRQQDFVALKAGWQPKVESIRELAEELNLGLDSFVFVDDSQVELASVREQLTVGAVVQVPEAADKYLAVLPDIAAQFSAVAGQGLGDRTEKYRVRAAAASLEKTSHSREDFLRGLQTRLRVTVDDSAQVGRVSELSERTNQFNSGLTRYSTGDIEAAMQDPSRKVITYDVSDRFGSSGVSAAVVLQIEPDVQVADWWISCRVLGRGVERAVLRHLLNLAAVQGADAVQVVFRPGPRNHQVLDLLSAVSGADAEQDGERVFRVPVDFEDGEGKWVEVVADDGQ